MRIAVVLNSISRRKKIFYRDLLPKLKIFAEVHVYETQSDKDDGIRIVREILPNDYNYLLSAGGDGTLNQVVNGMISSGRNDLPILGIIPIGSGNDFARSLNIKYDVASLISKIKKCNYMWADVGQVQYHRNMNNDEFNSPQYRFFINELDIGMGPIVVQKVIKNNRLFGAKLSYHLAILSSFLGFKKFKATIETPSWNWSGLIHSVAIANGKYYGHGLCIAPQAKPDDGVFSVFIAGDVSMIDFILCSNTLKNGKEVKLKNVHYREAKEIILTSNLPCIFETDGELAGMLPAKISILQNKIKILTN